MSLKDVKKSNRFDFRKILFNFYRSRQGQKANYAARLHVIKKKQQLS